MSKETKDAAVAGKTVIGVDYGESNTGVALGKDGFVYPLKTIKGKKPDSVMSELIRISLENKAELFVLGLPLAGDGKETAQSLKTRHFAKLLRIKSRKKVIFCNEENSTQEAYENLTISGVTGKKRTYSDDVAAAIILKRFFRENH